MPHRIEYSAKVFYGLMSLATYYFSWMGALLTEGETRWLCITMMSCLPTAVMLSLMFKKPTDPLQKAVGRAFLAILFGILATKPIAQYFGVEGLHESGNGIMLAGWSSASCGAGYLVGFPLLWLIERRSFLLASLLLNKIPGVPKEEPPKNEEP